MLVFNRPEVTARVFERVRAARPPRLLVVADGPRPDRPGEAERCAEVRAVVERVDWPCEVDTNYSETNLGCKRRVSSGLDWVFASVEEAILLEDDCLPDPSFFPFCDQLLERYRDDRRVAHITGDNFQLGRLRRLRTRLARNLPSYYFSRYPHVWGWASWRSVWETYDVDMKAWREADDPSDFLEAFSDRRERAFWKQTWDSVARGDIDTWDYQWAFACISRGALSIVPHTNLVSNIGFGEESTHTTGKSPVADIPTAEIAFPLHHPAGLERDHGADTYTAKLFSWR